MCYAKQILNYTAIIKTCSSYMNMIEHTECPQHLSEHSDLECGVSMEMLIHVAMTQKKENKFTQRKHDLNSLYCEVYPLSVINVMIIRTMQA